MASITQTIPSYNGGISQQPDELKVPGQLVDAVNVLPDITHGLAKRPGSKLVASLSDGTLNSVQTNSKWFHYYRDEAEQYVGQVDLGTGLVKMWKCSDGSEKAVSYTPVAWATATQYYIGDEVSANSKVYRASTDGISTGSTAPSIAYSGDQTVGGNTWTYVTTTALRETDIKNYLKTVPTDGSTITDGDIQTLTLNDATYITNRNKLASMGSEIEPVRENEAFLELKKVAYASQYAVNLFNDTSLTTVTTATRVSAELINAGLDSLLPNVGTKIYSINGIPEVQTIDTSSISADGWYQISDGTTTIEKNFNLDDSGNINLVRTERLAEGFRNHSDYHKLKFTIGTIQEKDDIHDSINYGTEFRLAFKEGGAQTTLATLKKLDGSGGSATATYTATETIAGVNSSDNVKENLYFRITTTGQGVPHQRDETPTYFGRYQIILDLLHGGEGWAKGQVLEVGFRSCSVQITVDEISTAKVQATVGGTAGAGLLRPTPTSFDTKTVVTAESILGELQTLITEIPLAGGIAIDHNDVNRSVDSNPHTITKTNHGLTTGDKIVYVMTNSATTAWTVTPDSTYSSGHMTPATNVLTEYWIITDGTDRFRIASSEWNANNGIYLYITGDGGSSGQTLYFPSTTSGWAPTVELIGNGIYIKNAGGSFNLSTPVGELLNVLTTSVKDIADLPHQCKHGYVVKVSNSVVEEDDYYLKFFGNNNRDGTGVWEECAKPGITNSLDPSTMPVQLRRLSNGTFRIQHLVWDKRSVGDTVTVTEPSFIGKPITKMLFFRNRMALLSDENINLSRPGSFYNFWPKTAMTYTATDNIDISCSSEYPAIIYDGIQVNSGLILFTKNQQFMLTTDSDVLSPMTAKINSVSTYNFNHNTNPISLGTTIGFLDNAGKNSRFFEMTNTLREGRPDVIEQTKIVSELFSKDLTLITNSRENGILFFATRAGNEIFGYRYFSSVEKRVINAWFRWTVHGTIEHMAVLDDSLYIVIRHDSKDKLIKFDIKTGDDSIETVEDQDTSSTTDDISYPVHLDGASNITIGSTYSNASDKTTFTIVAGAYKASPNLMVYGVTGDNIGRYATAEHQDSTTLWVPGNWNGVDIVVGYSFDMELKFPTIHYLTQTENGYKAMNRGSLVIHRLKFNFGPLGLYNTTLKRLGKSDYTETHEITDADLYRSSALAVTDPYISTVPVYEKNKNLSITLKSTHPTPATLYSMSWEGDYTNKYYKSV